MRSRSRASTSDRGNLRTTATCPTTTFANLDPVARAERYSFGIERADVPHTLLAVDEDEGRVLGFATTGPCADAGTRGRLGELYGL
jgi:hypothetical protein